MSIDTWASANAFAQSLGAEFPVLGDWPNNTVSRAYGVYDEERHTDRRMTFVIDKDGIIRHVIDEPRDFDKHSQDALVALASLIT